MFAMPMMHSRIPAWMARAPFRVGYAKEYSPLTGYEEGLTSGLAQILTYDCARMGVGAPSYPRYVRSYEILAEELGVPREELLKKLWEHPLGMVAQNLGSVVSGILHEKQGIAVTLEQTAALREAADGMFSRALDDGLVDIRGIWRGVLP